MGDLDYVQKGSAKVNGMYSFVSHDQVTAAIHPCLVKHGVIVLPTVDTLKQEGNRTEVKLKVHFQNVDNPNDAFVTDWYGYGIDGADKGIGKAISYAYKYALLKTFCLETGDDPDNSVSARYEPAKCVEFELMLPADLNEKDRQKLEKFLAYSSQVMGVHVEEVKKEAIKRMPDFIAKLRTWTPDTARVAKKPTSS